ncbi:hypothetical protein BC834DRAFT_847870, partial [Gloeopeniophorella convolvens]
MQAVAESVEDVEGHPNLAVAGEEASEMVLDDLPDREHERLDAELGDIFCVLADPYIAKTPLNPVAARFVLTTVVDGCDLLDSKYNRFGTESKNNVLQLFKEYPWLTSLVQECCINQTTRKLRLLKILRKPVVFTPKSPRVPTSSKRSRVRDDTEEEKQ